MWSAQLLHPKGISIMRRRRQRETVLVGLVGLIASIVYLAWPGSSTFTVSKETTYATEPLDSQGYVDYVTALNERLGKGIKPEDNANVLICQTLGPRPEGATMSPEYFEWLGIVSPPEKGEYLVSWRDYLKAHVQKDGKLEGAANNETLSRAAEWPWTAKEQPELADWLKQNDKPLALIVQATRRPAYYNPLVPGGREEGPALMGALLPTVQKCRELASALVSRAMLRIAQGKDDEAWQDLLTCHRLGRLLSRGGTLIEMLVGIAIERVAHKGDLVFLDHAKLTSKQVSACWEDLHRLPAIATIAEKVDLGDRFMLLDTMMFTARHGTTALEGLAGGRARPSRADRFTGRMFTRSINWDPALVNANRLTDRVVAALRIPDRSARMQEMAAIDQDLQALKRQVDAAGVIEKSFMGSRSRGEMIGNIMILLVLPSFTKVQIAADRCEQDQRNLHLAFALAAYKCDQGLYPAKLDELAPKYLQAIPGDLFSGKPPIYRLNDKGYLLYSVGENGVDDGGRGNDDFPRGDDLSIRMPVARPSENNEGPVQK